MPSTHPTPALLRGCVVGATTGVLAIAAHGAAGGGHPSSTGIALLLLTALVAGAAAGSIIGDTGRWHALPGGILLPLGAGQFLGHRALTGLTGHHDTASGTTEALPPAAMFAAHLVAVVVCAVAISAAERLYRAASSVLRTLLEPRLPAPGTSRIRVTPAATAAAHNSPNGASGPRAPPARTAPAAAPVPLGEKASNTCPTGSPPACAGV